MPWRHFCASNLMCSILEVTRNNVKWGNEDHPRSQFSGPGKFFTMSLSNINNLVIHKNNSHIFLITVI